ncbi:MAG: hypothetical protein ACLSCO_17625 [Gallintestinimicrobium sp.]
MRRRWRRNAIRTSRRSARAACPFRLDIKGLEEKWKKGRFNAAYRTYQNTVGFPDIVSKLCSHPCEKACLRAKLDGGIAIGLLERATVEYVEAEGTECV